MRLVNEIMLRVNCSCSMCFMVFEGWVLMWVLLLCLVFEDRIFWVFKVWMVFWIVFWLMLREVVSFCFGGRWELLIYCLVRILLLMWCMIIENLFDVEVVFEWVIDVWCLVCGFGWLELVLWVCVMVGIFVGELICRC